MCGGAVGEHQWAHEMKGRRHPPVFLQCLPPFLQCLPGGACIATRSAWAQAVTGPGTAAYGGGTRGMRLGHDGRREKTGGRVRETESGRRTSTTGPNEHRRTDEQTRANTHAAWTRRTTHRRTLVCRGRRASARIKAHAGGEAWLGGGPGTRASHERRQHHIKGYVRMLARNRVDGQGARAIV